MPRPLTEDWSFKFVGEFFLLRHLFKSSIKSRSEYDALRIGWNAEANRRGEYASSHPEPFWPIPAKHEPGQILHDLDFVTFDGTGDQIVSWHSEGSGELRLTAAGYALARLLFQKPFSYHRAVVAILLSTEDSAYFVTRPGYESPSFFAGLIGKNIFETRDYFRWLAENGWTSNEYSLDIYKEELPRLTERGRSEARQPLGKPPAMDTKRWWERPLGILVLGIAVTVAGGLIVWGITRHYDSGQSAVPVASEKPTKQPQTQAVQPESSPHETTKSSRPSQLSAAKKRSKPANKVPSLAPTPPKVEILAPNGIAIGGGIVNNPTVNNFGPPPQPTPTVTICTSQPPTTASGLHTTVITLRTSVKIPQPWYAFFFDGPVLEGSVGMEPHSFGYTHGRADKLPNPKNTFLFRTSSIDFGPPTWLPGQEIRAIVPSKDQVHLTRIMSGSEESGLDEKFVFRCE